MLDPFNGTHPDAPEIGAFLKQRIANAAPTIHAQRTQITSTRSFGGTGTIRIIVGHPDHMARTTPQELPPEEIKAAIQDIEALASANGLQVERLPGQTPVALELKGDIGTFAKKTARPGLRQSAGESLSQLLEKNLNHKPTVTIAEEQLTTQRVRGSVARSGLKPGFTNSSVARRFEIKIVPTGNVDAAALDSLIGKLGQQTEKHPFLHIGPRETLSSGAGIRTSFEGSMPEFLRLLEKLNAEHIVHG